MQKKLKRKDRGRGRGGNKGSDGFHEVCTIKGRFQMWLLQITACFALTEGYFKINVFKLYQELHTGPTGS